MSSSRINYSVSILLHVNQHGKSVSLLFFSVLEKISKKKLGSWKTTFHQQELAKEYDKLMAMRFKTMATKSI